jgi:hypothetical protein
MNYIKSVMDKLYLTWIPPIGSKGKSIIVQMTIARSGQLIKARIEELSGLPALDQAAMNICTFQFLSPICQAKYYRDSSNIR